MVDVSWDSVGRRYKYITLTHSRDCITANQPALWEDNIVIQEMLSLALNGSIYLHLVPSTHFAACTWAHNKDHMKSGFALYRTLLKCK